MVLGRFVRIPINGHDMDGAFSGFILDFHAFDPILGSQLLRDRLAAMDSALDSPGRVVGPWRHRIFSRDGYVWLHDDRSQHFFCSPGPDSKLGWNRTTTR